VFTVLDGLVNTVDNKDCYTREHSEDVIEHAIALAAELDLPPETKRPSRIAGLLHDVGRIGMLDHILRNPGPLTAEEFATAKQHVDLGELIRKR
jgi:HD-GYP domain-containing protein (c-di-GMP phosphodiesterase class II)